MALHLDTSRGALSGCRGCGSPPQPPFSPCSGGVCGLGSSGEGSLGSRLAEGRCTGACHDCSWVKD